MNRRDALSSVALLLGGTILGAEAFLAGCKNGEQKAGIGLDFSPDDLAFLDEVGETILPTTATSPGAKAAEIGKFMKTIVTDCYTENDHKMFKEGIGKLNDFSNKQYSKNFMELSATEKHDLLAGIDKEFKAYSKQVDAEFNALVEAQKTKTAIDHNKTGVDPKGDKMREYPHYYFTMMKQLTLWGYFSSKPGATQALRYVAVPTRYEGCIPYKKGDKAWAT